jgi:hypothetical protein
VPTDIPLVAAILRISLWPRVHFRFCSALFCVLEVSQRDAENRLWILSVWKIDGHWIRESWEIPSSIQGFVLWITNKYYEASILTVRSENLLLALFSVQASLFGFYDFASSFSILHFFYQGRKKCMRTINGGYIKYTFQITSTDSTFLRDESPETCPRNEY